MRMPPMSDPKRQHWVPECYLKAWRAPQTAEDKPGVWRIDRRTRLAELLPIKAVCVEGHIYTARSPDGTKGYRIERALSTIEGPYERAISNKVVPGATLDSQDEANIIVFASAMLAKLPCSAITSARNGPRCSGSRRTWTGP